MKKSILNLEGVQALKKSELKSLNGGGNCWEAWDYCEKNSETFKDFDSCMISLGCG